MVGEDAGRAEPDPYRELFERSADAILIIEGETFVDCNQATVEMLRYANKEQLLRTHPSELSPPRQPDGRDSYEKANEMISRALEHGSHRFEWDHMRADGEVFPVEVSLTAVQRDGRRILNVLWRDITERKRLEQELRQAQKMEAIGKLAGGIAHDFNNLLVAILGHADMLRRRLDAGSPLAEHAEEIRGAGDRAASLVRQVLTFSRKKELQTRVLDVRRVVGDLEKMLTRLIGEDVRLTTARPAEPVHIKADPGQIEQVVINLVTNARDAMPDGGTVDVRLSAGEVDETAARGVAGLEPGSYAVLEVTDTGIGMDGDTLARALDPFFTTKSLGRGTGLGLSTVYGIVRQSGGTLDIDSHPGRGTTVRVYLPSTRDIEEPAPRDRRVRPAAAGSETILVAEDEPAVAALVVDVLRSQQYDVLLARDGLEALELWSQNRGRIDLLLTDVVMPRLGGVPLVQRIRADGYEGPVLFASGYTNDALAALDGMNERTNLLEKPFSPDELLVRVERVLGREPRPRDGVRA